MPSKLLPIYTAKAARVYVSGMLSILLPFYLTVLGYSPFFVGLALAVILAGNAISNIVLTSFERHLGRRGLLMVFSLLMVVSGLGLALASGPMFILAACLIGNISTTGTEAGPFQSVEAGILPDLAGGGGATKAFGAYNLIGYLASSVGAFTASAPDYLGGGLPVYRGLFAVFALAGALLLFIYSRLRGIEPVGEEGRRAGLSSLEPPVRREVVRLSALYSADAFGGSFVSQYVMTYWFHQSYGVELAVLGTVFLATNLISALSIYTAAIIATKLGNLRTMFSTHLVSNVFLLLIPFAGTLTGALTFLFLRQSTSQMDVPTRQAFMAELFDQKDRVTANAVTNTSRSVSSFLGGPVSAAMFAVGLISGPPILGGIAKVAYDFAIFGTYRERFR
ncbi:MAG: MFS transporter [Nitrososphaerales archaeon]|nr:MFS transporter [Nitrososphaerales archaeon]